MALPTIEKSTCLEYWALISFYLFRGNFILWAFCFLGILGGRGDDCYLPEAYKSTIASIGK